MAPDASIVTLPSTPAPVGAEASLVSKATEMSGPLGGPTQRVLRVGSRFKVDFTFGDMTYDQARQWIARTLAAEAAPAAMIFPQRGFRATSPDGVGSTVSVKGAQTATTNTGGVLSIKGGLAGFELVSGQFFHINATVDGRRYLHQIRDDATFAADGTATLAIQPPLRFVPADGDTTEWVNPMMEGFITTGWTWTIELVRRVGLKFTLTEDR
ncbi:MAG: hypothetical protein ACYDD1_04425 [Caulobacteraceae bacterium]